MLKFNIKDFSNSLIAKETQDITLMPKLRFHI